MIRNGALTLFLLLLLMAQVGQAQNYDRNRNYPTNPYQESRPPYPSEYGSFSYGNNGAPENRRPMNEATLKQGWQARNLLQGPAAIVKGIGASVWCIGNTSYVMYRDVDSFGQGFVQTLLWPFAVTIDSIASFSSYEVIGLAHTITGGALVSEPPKQIEEMSAPIYCVLSDNMN